MKKIFTTLSLFAFFTVFIQAQSINWVKQFGDSSEDVLLDVVTDNSGNTYSTGYFGEISTFDEITLNALGYFNGFVTKTDSNGNVLWAKALSQPDDGDVDPYHSVIPRSVSVDTNGNVIVVGYFDSGDFDADPGTGEHILSAGNYEMFILKLNSDGDFLWATSFGSSEEYFEVPYSVKTDANNDIYLTGVFTGSIAIDHAAGTSTITSYGASDIFVMKYFSGGYFSWMQNMGGSDYDLGIDLDISSNGDVYVTGKYKGTSTFYAPFLDPNPITLETTTDYHGVFALKLDGYGTFQNVVKIGEADSEGIGMSIAVDTNDFAYVTGYYGGILTANQNTAEEVSIDSDGNYEAFVAKVDFTNDNVSWLKEIDGGSGSVFGYAVDTDSNNNLYVSGFYSESINVGTYSLTNQTDYAQENYLISLSDSGDFLGAYKFGGINVVDSQSINVDENDNVIIAGSFRQTVDINPFASEDLVLTSQGFRDNYIMSVQNSNLLSANEYFSNNSFQIYPNPVKDVLYVSTDISNMHELNYTIADISGKSVLSGTLGFNRQIDLHNLKSGVYFVSINNNQQIFKILKK